MHLSTYNGVYKMTPPECSAGECYKTSSMRELTMMCSKVLSSRYGSGYRFTCSQMRWSMPQKACHRGHQLLTDTGHYRDKDGIIYLPPEETAHTQEDAPQPLVSCQVLCLEGQATKLHDHHLTKHIHFLS